MRKLLVLGTAALISASTSAYVQRQPADGQQSVTFTVTGTYSDGTTRGVSDRMYHVTTDFDSDGDGRMDEGVLTLKCSSSGGTATARFKIEPRDSASGMATGKRQYQPLVIKRLADGGAAPAPSFKGGWDLATSKGGRGMSPAHATRIVTFPLGSSACRAAGGG